jgi:hypothetical protein
MGPNNPHFWDDAIAKHVALARENHACRMTLLAALRRDAGLSEAQRLRFLSLNAITGNRRSLPSDHLRWLRKTRAEVARRVHLKVAA